MRKTKSFKALAGRSLKRVEAETTDPGTVHENLPEASRGSYSYTTQTVFRDPKTGRRVPVNVGVVVSPGYIMTWLKT